jgi:hypothetical protein
MEDKIKKFKGKDDLNILLAGRRPQTKIMQPYAMESKIMVVAPLRVTYLNDYN